MRIVTKDKVNIRSGPGMIFDVANTSNAGIEFNSHEYRKDDTGIGWYKVDDGWICAEYVSLAKDATASNLVFNLRKNDEGDDEASGEGGTVEVTAQASDKSNIGSDNGFLRSETSDDPGGRNSNIMWTILNRKMFGVPYQFRDTVDPRMSTAEGGGLGYDFLSMMAEAPYVSVMPGKPLFLPDLDKTQKDDYVKYFTELINPLQEGDSVLISPGDFGDFDIKYFGFQSDYDTYIQYVNTMCWMLALFMGIQDSVIIPGLPENEGGKNRFLGSAGRFDWRQYRLGHLFGMTDPTEKKQSNYETAKEKVAAAEGAKDLATAVWDYFTAETSREEYYTDFYINPNVSYSESFSNGTSPSMLEGAISGASDMAKEMAFLLSAGVDAANAAKSQEELAKMIKGMSGSPLTDKGILGRLFGAASTIISGQNIAFPEIWKSSDFSRSYNIEITLKTPYGTRESIFMDLMVPMAHWICLAAPRQATINTYGAPFLVKCYIPGFCAIDMGIVDSLTISKGGDGSAWSVEGFPLEINLSISIKDMYSALSMGRINFISPTDAYNFIWNSGFIDYVGLYGGLNMKQSEAAKRKGILTAIAQNQLDPEYIERRAVEGVLERAREWVNNFKL